MPIYEYRCSACDRDAELLHAVDAPGPEACPACGARGTMRKRFAAPAIHYRGSGWAKKDRGGSGAAKAAKPAAAGDAAPATPSPAPPPAADD